MQAVTNEQTTSTENTQPLTISAEMIAYIALLSFAIILRFSGLGAVPMTDAEAVQALPAYHAVDSNAAGTPQPASSVIVFWLQRISFTFFGGSEFAARLSGVMGGIALILMPLTLRRWLKREVTFILALILAFSPIAFTSARFSDATLWTMVFAIATLAAVLRYWEFPTQENALIIAGTLTATVFLSGSSGILLLIIWILASILTLIWMVYTAPDELDSPGDEILSEVRAFLDRLPLLPMLALGGGLTFILATGFLVDTDGLNIVAVAIQKALQGFIFPIPNAPVFFAVFSLIVYEPILVVLGIVSAIMMLTSHNDSVVDRFVMSWLVVGTVFLLVYQGTSASDALLLVVPLSYLTARMIAELLVNYMPSFLSLESYTSNDPNDYIWIKWTVAIAVVAGFIMLSLYLATVGRAFLTYSGNFLATDQNTILLYARLGWLLIMVVLMIVMYFLFASMWGNRNVIQGYGLGAFSFMLLMGIGTGWNTSVVQVYNPAELWYQTAIARDATQLRDTLFDVSRRDTRGFPSINMVILRDEASGISGDGLIAWLVRDFDNARFVDTIADVRQEEIILLPELEEDPDLGGSYVGQRFVIREYGLQRQGSILDSISWYTHRKTRSYVRPQDSTVLWLRIDVYDGIPSNQRP